MLVSALGYRTDTLTISEPGRNLTVKLAEAPTGLKGITVKAPAIRAQGDTLTFDVAAFCSRSDRNIEAVIGRLPGITIEGNGQIKYNGESINKFYIEGLDMLSGRYQLATKNFSPTDIAAVNIYENHQPKKVLEGLEFSERAALNLKLKKKSMLRPVGHLTGGIGTDGDDIRWLGEGFGMMVSPDMQMMFTLKANNFGTGYANELSARVSGGASVTPALAGKLFQKNLFGTPPLSSSRYSLNRSVMGSANALTRLNRETTLTFNAAWMDDRSRFANSNITRYMGLPGGPLTIIENNGSVLRSRTGSVAFRLETNSSGFYIQENLLLNGEFNDNLHRLEAGRKVTQRQNTDSHAAANRFNLILRKGPRVWEIKSDISVANLPVNSINARDTGADTLIVDQSVKGLTFRSTHSTSFSRYVTKESMLGIDVSFKADYDRIRSGLVTVRIPERGASTSGYRLVTGATPYWQLNSSSLSAKLELPVSMYDFGYTHGTGRERFSHHRPYLDCRATVSYITLFKLRSTLRLSHTHSLSDIMDFITGPIYTSYRSETVPGSGALGITASTGGSCSLNYRNTPIGFNSAFNASFRRSRSNMTSSSGISEDLTATTLIARKSRRDALNIGGHASEYVRSILTTIFLDAAYNCLWSETMRNDSWMKVRTSSVILHPSVKSILFSDRMTVDLGFTYQTTSQKMSVSAQTNRIDNYSGELSVTLMPLYRFEIYGTAAYTDTDLGSSGRKRDLFLDCGTRLLLGRWEIELKMRNLTDRDSYTTSRFTGDDSYVTTYMLRPREGMVSLRWSF